jgi:hypothetical protein
MGLDKRKMEDRRRQAAEREAAGAAWNREANS